MGKAKAKRNRQAAGDPLRRPQKPPTDPELAALREEKILPVLKDLQSSESNKRSMAATAISNMIDNDKCRRLLLREQLVPIIMKNTLTDSSPDGRAAGWDVLRTVAELEDSGFCVHLYRLDILTAIEFACKAILETLESKEPPFERMNKGQQSIVWRISSCLCSLVGALAGAQDDILVAICETDKIVEFLVTLLSQNFVEPDLLDELLSATMVLSEDNALLCDIIASYSALEILLKLKDIDGTTAVLVCGVLHNVFSALRWNDNNPGHGGSTDHALIPRLVRTLQDFKGLGEVQNGGDWTAPSEIIVVALEVLAAIATSVQDTLGDKRGLQEGEVRPGDPEVEEEDDEMQDGDVIDTDELDSGDKGSDGGDESMDEEAIAEDMDAILGHSADAKIDKLPTLESLLNNALPQVLRLVELGGQSEPEMVIRTHAVSVLNNLAWSLSCVDFSNGQNAGLLKAWQPHAAKMWEQAISPVLDSDTEDLELATEITGLAWALARTLKDKVPLKEGQHRKFISLYQAAKKFEDAAQNGNEKKPIADDDDPFQTLGVKCIGVLGRLAVDPAPVGVNREVGTFLITIVTSLPTSRPAEVVEALDQIFDIYGDEEAACDKEVFWKDSFLKHLQDSTMKVKAMLKGIHKKDEKSQELRARAEEAVMNLDRFVKYKKKKHRPSEKE